MYDLPTNVSSVSGLLTWVNTVTGNIFWSMVLLSSVIITTISLISTDRFNKDIAIAFVGSMFVNFLFAVLLRTFELVSNQVVGMLLFGLVGSIMYLYSSR